MAEINESVYGASEDWVDAVSYASSATDSQKLKYANFNNEEFYKSRIATAIGANKLNLDTPWDNSLSYCGLGVNHPLSNITWYWVEGTNEVGQTNILKVLYQEQKDVTNFALGTSYSPIYGPTGDDVDCYRLTDNGSNNKFRFSRWNNSAAFDGSFSNYATFQPFTQMPLHRVVLCPIIVCSSNNNDDIHYMDLANYLQASNKSNFPRVRQINVDIYVDYLTPYEDQDVVRPGYEDINIDWKAWEDEHPGYEYRVHRQGLGDTNAMPILDTTHAFDGLIDTTGPTPVELNNVYLPITAGHAAGSTGITIAGHLFGARGIGTGDVNRTRVFGVASGFGINFSEVAHKSDIRPDVIANGAFLYCDASKMSNNAFREAVRRMVACFGLFFVDSHYDATLPLDHERMMLGILRDGVGNGQYTNGVYNRDHEQWLLDDAHDINYDPGAPTPASWDPNSYLDTMNWSSLANFKTCTERYNLQAGQIDQIFSTLWTLWDTFDPEAITDGSIALARIDLKQRQSFLTNNPLDCIVGCKYFPITENMSTGSATGVKVGVVTLTQPGGSTEIQAPNAKNSIHFDCGRVYCAPQYQTQLGKPDTTWLDQYVGFELYLPFCGNVKLDTATYINKWVTVEYDIDLITGCCSASIGVASSETEGSLFMEIRNGVCCIDVPITGIQQSTIESNYFNAITNMKSNKNSFAYSMINNVLDFGQNVANKDAMGAINSGLKTLNNIDQRIIAQASENYNLTHTQLPTRTIGTAGAINSAECYLKPILIVTEPILNIPSDYAHTIGYACLEYGTIGNYKGNHYREITNVDLSGFTCTETEKEMIRSLLASGVYV